MLLSEKQQIQEEQYHFPYHHLVDYTGKNISLLRQWPWALSYLGRIELACDTLKSLGFQTLLDIGCGDGKLLSVLSDIYKEKEFYGIDYSEQAIVLAKLLCKNMNVEYTVEDIISSPKNKQFDVVTLIEVIEHIPPENLHSFLVNVKKYLVKDKAGGGGGGGGNI
jgi:2-polyprenyl-3-methyl-5-hydroxy-6-metoxy-1,4-benzoquinol methylase